jgi:uncharacterized protein
VERQLTWAGTDAWRAESALVRRQAERFTVSGVQLGVVPLPYRLDYRLEAGPGWVTRLLEVTALGEGWQRSARLERADAGSWTYRQLVLGEVDLPVPGCETDGLEGALDCDLGFSPLTNTMPVLRHALHRRPGVADLTTAWMSVPDLTVVASPQRYEHVRVTDAGAVVRFTSRDFTAALELDRDGFVVDYPDLARRVP